jgi:hypothetical protein
MWPQRDDLQEQAAKITTFALGSMRREYQTGVLQTSFPRHDRRR